MKNIYSEIERRQQDEIRELEVESAKYTEAYNNIKHDKAYRSMSPVVLRTVEFALYIGAAVSFMAFVWIETWDIKAWSNLIYQGNHLTPLGAAIMTASTLGWKIVTAGICGASLTLRWVIGRIRNKNRVIHQQAELLNEMLNKLGTNLYKVKKAQDYFESLSDGERKEEVSLVS